MTGGREMKNRVGYACAIFICIFAGLTGLASLMRHMDAAQDSLEMPEGVLCGEPSLAPHGKYCDGTWFDGHIELAGGYEAKVSTDFTSRKKDLYQGRVDGVEVALLAVTGDGRNPDGRREIFSDDLPNAVFQSVGKAGETRLCVEEEGYLGEHEASYYAGIRDNVISIRKQKEYFLCICLHLPECDFFVFTAATEADEVDDALQLVRDMASLVCRRNAPVPGESGTKGTIRDLSELEGFLKPDGDGYATDVVEGIYTENPVTGARFVVEYENMVEDFFILVTDPLERPLAQDMELSRAGKCVFEVTDGMAGTYHAIVSSGEDMGRIKMYFEAEED